MLRRKIELFSIFFLITLLNFYANDYAMGPIAGKNLYLPHLGSFSFPGKSAVSAGSETGSLNYQFYFINEFSSYPLAIDKNDQLIDKGFDPRSLDYESSIGEISYHFPINSRVSIDSYFRIFSYYPGYFDFIIDGFHNSLDLPDAGRSYFGQNQLLINLECEEYTQKLTSSVFATGDTDLLLNLLLFQSISTSFSFNGAIKFPTGNFNYCTGSGVPDIALMIKGDIGLFPEMTLYLQSGGIFPLNLLSVHEYKLIPQFQEIISLEWHPQSRISLILQSNIMSSPITGKENFSKSIFAQEIPVFSMIQTNLKCGIHFRDKFGVWQLYFEEDPFTYAGVDILVSLGHRIFFQS